MMDVCLAIFAFNFWYHIPNLIHRCLALLFRNKITPESAPIFFQCSSSFRPEDGEIANVVRCRSAFLRFLMASLQSSISHCLPECFGFVEVFGIVASAIDITVPLNFKIESVAFRIISVWSFSLHTCSYRDQSALSNLYRVSISPTVEFKLSRIIGKWSLPWEI